VGGASRDNATRRVSRKNERGNQISIAPQWATWQLQEFSQVLIDAIEARHGAIGC
jgi:hypothetical protein